MQPRNILALAALGLAVGVAACSGSAAATPSPTVAATPVPSVASSSSPSVASATTVMATAVGTMGTVLVDGKTEMTLYVFARDVPDSGTSNCTGACLTRWPALTVPDGTTPTAGDGVMGTLATITRADDGTRQVTYNGLPLYFFEGDTAPGDANGVYTSWSVVQP